MCSERSPCGLRCSHGPCQPAYRHNAWRDSSYIVKPPRFKSLRVAGNNTYVWLPSLCLDWGKETSHEALRDVGQTVRGHCHIMRDYTIIFMTSITATVSGTVLGLTSRRHEEPGAFLLTTTPKEDLHAYLLPTSSFRGYKRLRIFPEGPGVFRVLNRTGKG